MLARLRQRRAVGQRKAEAPPATNALAHMLALPSVDRMLGRLLARPRLLQLAGVAFGALMVAMAIVPMIWQTAPAAEVELAPTAETNARTPVQSGGLVDHSPSASERDVLAIVTAYNQASIAAAALGRAEPLAAYLEPDGPAWAAAEREYQRRAERAEAHEPALVHWGVLNIKVTGDTATVETQEQWDDLTSVGGQVVSSRRGILTRNVYSLHRSSSLHSWLIRGVTTTTVIG